MPAGYSGTPLVKKLGIKEGHDVGLDRAPSGFDGTLGLLPSGARSSLLGRSGACDVILSFARSTAELQAGITRALTHMGPRSALWLCWAKKSSPLATEVTGDVVRNAGLAAGVVDIKVAAIDEDWSGLKFVYRVADRKDIALRKRVVVKK